MTVEAILYDMDGVVVDSMRFHAEAWKQVFSEYGVVLDDIDIYRREGMSGRQSIEDIFKEKRQPVPEEREFQNLLAKKHALFERCHIGLFPYIEQILTWAGSMKMRSALVTGSLKRSVDHVMPQTVLSRFDAIITAEDVLKGKPDPEPFIRALECLGARADRSLIIENSPMGIRSARAAGVVCYAVETTLPRRYLTEADKIFSGHRELLEYLKSNIR